MPTVTTIALDVIAKDLQLGLPYPLEIPARGATAAERAQLRRQAEDELRDAELLDHTGRVVTLLEHWLRILARPEVSIDSAYLPALDATPVRAIVARSGKSTVLATQRHDNAVQALARLTALPRWPDRGEQRQQTRRPPQVAGAVLVRQRDRPLLRAAGQRAGRPRLRDRRAGGRQYIAPAY